MNKTTIKSTPYGPVVIFWDLFDAVPKITRVLLSKPSLSALEKAKELYPLASEASCEEIDHVAGGMLRLLGGSRSHSPLMLQRLIYAANSSSGFFAPSTGYQEVR